MFRMILKRGGTSNVFYEDSNTDESQKVLEPKLEIQENAAGKLTFTVPPTNVLYSSFGFVDEDESDDNTIDSWVDVYKENQMYWSGRIISRQVDFWKCVKVECEGLLAVLNDTIQPPYHYQNITPRSFLEALLTVHNGRVNDVNRMIFMGNVTVGTEALGSNHRYTNYETTLTCILEKLVKNIGGRIKLRYDRYGAGGRWYLDYLADYDQLNSQTIEFGRNLFEYSRSMSSADYCTVVIPRGKQLESGPYEALTAYLTVASVNSGDIHVSLTAADYGGSVPGGRLPQEIYGNIEKVVDWNDVEDASTLLAAGKAWLMDKQFADMQLEVGAMDLHYAGGQYQVIEIGNSVRVISPPHGMDRIFPVTKMEIKLDTPEDTIFTLGKTASISMTSQANNQAANVQEQFANIPTEQKLTGMMRSEATELIEHATTGYINIIQNDETGAQELVFSKVPNYRESVGIWRWTYNGLGWKPGLYGDENEYTIAITNDGRINADFVSTGTLIADIIKAGILTSQDGNNNFWFNMATGEYSIRALDELIDDSQYFVTLTQLEQTASSITASAAATYATLDQMTAAQAAITINATNISSKVSLDDYNGGTIASLINQSATSVVIQAAHISLAGKTISLTSDDITIDSTYFKVSKTGAITATSGTIGGFTIGTNALYTAGSSSTSSGSIYLSNVDFTRSIGGTNRSGLRLAVGANFAIGATGALYANDAVIKGTVNATTLSSTNASITGGYFRVTTSSADDSRIELNYGSYKATLSPYTLLMNYSSGNESTSVRPEGIRNTVSGVNRFTLLDGPYFSLINSSSKRIMLVNNNYIQTALNANGDLARTAKRAFNDNVSASLTSGTWGNVLRTEALTTGRWVLTGGVSFPDNSVGIRMVCISTSSASSSPVCYGASVSVSPISGSATVCNVAIIVEVTSGSQYFYLNGYQNSGSSKTVRGSLRAVCIG